MKPALMGGVAGGVLSATPFVGGFLVCCFCLPTLAAAALALYLYFKERPHERITPADAALCGGMTGAVSGAVSSLLGYLVSLVFGATSLAMLGGLSRDIPDLAGAMASGGLMIFISLPISAIVYGLMGALGGFLSLQLFYKDRLAQ
ncbi:uncharacterized protein CMC5_081050 [Chondromyces crocatus]|uniref:DUF4199 domain-containing protein n=2 Tax=Chondromyces crocatus TaxID=52 RepID=A0A0K1ETA8_CHOCO|nr:uncharacterized protein CMC5_081050 [Chondromyces crocatus]